MTTDTPKHSTQQSHAYPDRSRQSLTFSNAATAERSRSVVLARLACLFLLVSLVCLAGAAALYRGSSSAHFRSQGPFSNDRLRQFGQSASNGLQNCTATSSSAVRKWARQHSRINRKRPADWEPKAGWPEELEMTQSLRHSSDQALTALDNVTDPSKTTGSHCKMSFSLFGQCTASQIFLP